MFLKQLPRNIIISRTDSIGDVILTLPLAKFLKEYFPGIKIGFLGKRYTRAVIEACKYVDEFIDLDDFFHKPITVGGHRPECILHVFPVPKIAQRAHHLRIRMRVGTINRLYHWLTCNVLVKLSRKNSMLHEAQLNLRLLRPLGIRREFSLKEIQHSFGLELLEPLPDPISALVSKNKYNLILHPKSQGSAREWGLPQFIQLINSLDTDRFSLFISGTGKDGEQLKPLLDAVKGKVTDITGAMNLPQFISFIQRCDGLIASSTGPIHIAAALGRDALGIYPPLRPIHPGRWAPLGPKALYFVLDKKCTKCAGNQRPCQCIQEVQPAWIKSALEKLSTNK